MLMLNLASTMQTQLKMLARGDRSNFTDHLQVPHVELNGKTLGVIGAGKIARQVIRIAQAMDMNVLCHARKPRENEENLTFVPLEQLLRESDFITIHCPLTPQTRHLIDEQALAVMKPTAFLINTARGEIVEQKQLVRFLKTGKLFAAGLDVFPNNSEVEPELLDMPNVVLTPHIGSNTNETRKEMSERIVSIVKAVCDDEAVLKGNLVNAESLKARKS